MNYNNESVCTIVALHHPEMPNSGYIKSGDSFFKHNSIQSLIGLGLYMKSYMSNRTITVSFYDCNGEIIKYVRKCPRKRTLNQRKFKFWEKIKKIPNWSTEKLITRFYPGIWWPVREEIVVVSRRVGMYVNHTWQLIVFNRKVQT